MKLLLYLDTCSLQRPLDNRDQVRIKLEAEAVLCILELVEAGTFGLVSSDALLYEANQNFNKIRREHVLSLLSEAKTFSALDTSVRSRSKKLVEMGFKSLDAFHLASAESVKADYFCTCDDRLVRRAKKLAGVRIKVVTPVELIKVTHQ